MRALAVAALMMSGASAPALAQYLPPIGGPTPPLVHRHAVEQHAAGFRDDAQAAERALGSPLNYVSGRPGNEIYLTFRNLGGSGLFYNRHRLYLQFRNGRLAGWKGDWGHNWMWQ